jgi:hypothetical protein
MEGGGSRVSGGGGSAPEKVYSSVWFQSVNSFVSVANPLRFPKEDAPDPQFPPVVPKLSCMGPIQARARAFCKLNLNFIPK